jgi:hypothetical protein
MNFSEWLVLAAWCVALSLLVVFVARTASNAWREWSAEQAEKDRQEKARVAREAADELRLRVMDMEASPCPIRKDFCSRDCVHFDAGSSFAMDRFDGGYFPAVLEPKCRLWGRR